MTIIQSFINHFQEYMQTVEKLYVNITNRLPLIPQPSLFNNNYPLPHQIHHKYQHNEQKKSFAKMQNYLQQEIYQAKEQYQIMQDLFTSLEKIQQGEMKQTKKLQRRCMKDILDKFYCTNDNCNKYYSSLPSLQRHVKMKHSASRNQPPLLYHDLHPQPNLTHTSQQDLDESEQEKMGQSSSGRELI